MLCAAIFPSSFRGRPQFQVRAATGLRHSLLALSLSTPVILRRRPQQEQERSLPGFDLLERVAGKAVVDAQAPILPSALAPCAAASAPCCLWDVDAG